jgi:hypothetical protein
VPLGDASVRVSRGATVGVVVANDETVPAEITSGLSGLSGSTTVQVALRGARRWAAPRTAVSVVVDETDAMEVTAIVTREDGTLVSATLAAPLENGVALSESGVVPTTPFSSAGSTQLVFGTTTKQALVYVAAASPRVYGRCVLGADGAYDVFDSRGRAVFELK